MRLCPLLGGLRPLEGKPAGSEGNVRPHFSSLCPPGSRLRPPFPCPRPVVGAVRPANTAPRPPDPRLCPAGGGFALASAETRTQRAETYFGRARWRERKGNSQTGLTVSPRARVGSALSFLEAETQ